MAGTMLGTRFGKRLAAGRRVAFGIGAGLLLAGAGCAPSTEPAVVVITIDTLRADHLGTYGYFRDTAPELEALARESLVFENAYSIAPTTLPSHVALWTSRYPNQTGVYRNRNVFDAREGGPPRLLAQWLQNAGWSTAAFVSATPVGADTGLTAGFDVYEAPRSTRRTATKTTRKALEWLEDAKPPYFLWVHYFDVHSPYEPPEAHRIFAADDALRDFLAERAFADPDDAEVQSIHDRYDGGISYADAEIGRLLGHLRGRREWDRLAVVVTADHGEGLEEHGQGGHVWLGREQLHVPLLMKLPASLGVTPGRRSDLASSVDVVPTLAANLGLPVPPEIAAEFEGVDLLSETRDHAFSQRLVDGWSLVTPEWRFVEQRGVQGLFDRRSDPNELENLAADQPERAAELRARAIAAAGAVPEDGTLLEVRPLISQELRRQLGELGYVAE